MLSRVKVFLILMVPDEVVKNKESHKQKLEAEDAQYLEKRKDRARKIIQYEKEELARREEEVE